MQTAKIFRNGGSQAVRLPAECALPGREVYVRKVGRSVVLVPMDDPWGSLEVSLDQFTDDFLAERDQLPVQEREEL